VCPAWFELGIFAMYPISLLVVQIQRAAANLKSKAMALCRLGLANHAATMSGPGCGRLTRVAATAA
jgi:hypothetical protein